MIEQTLRISGRVLYLSADEELLRRQLGGQDLTYPPERPLLDYISTDEIAPSWACYHYDDTLARYALVGLRGGLVGVDAIRNGGFEVLVCGHNKGSGSSREAAPYAELRAGIRLVIAKSFEKIYRQNCQNIGLFTATDFGLLERIANREEIPLSELASGLDPLSAEIVLSGGLFGYTERRLAGHLRFQPFYRSKRRPMTLVEKIIADHVVTDATSVQTGVRSVQPGEAVFVRADVRFSHEYTTAMTDTLFRAGFGETAELYDASTVYAFRDHLTLLHQVIPEERIRMGLLEQAQRLEVEQRRFAKRHAIRLFGEVVHEGRPAGSEAICHNKVIEELALPGQIVVGTDSHTCMAGALGCFAFGVGSTDMAVAWRTGDVRIRVPSSVRVLLTGSFAPNVCAKDLMLYLFGLSYFKQGKALGHALEFSGEALRQLALDERATLANMSVEAGAFTGIIAADQALMDQLARIRGLNPESLNCRALQPDPDAQYADTVTIDLGRLEPMVATPGDPRNSVALSRLLADNPEVPIDIAYGGSCTGSKKADMDMYAHVLGRAL
ncbi:MAG TPA: aconitase family protein, partial [Polyangiaceae bacterium]